MENDEFSKKYPTTGGMSTLLTLSTNYNQSSIIIPKLVVCRSHSRHSAYRRAPPRTCTTYGMSSLTVLWGPSALEDSPQGMQNQDWHGHYKEYMDANGSYLGCEASWIRDFRIFHGRFLFANLDSWASGDQLGDPLPCYPGLCIPMLVSTSPNLKILVHVHKLWQTSYFLVI